MEALAGKTCSSCGRLTSEYTEFKCPQCGNSTIIRCGTCRENHNTYKCNECKFEGP